MISLAEAITVYKSVCGTYLKLKPSASDRQKMKPPNMQRIDPPQPMNNAAPSSNLVGLRPMVA